MSLSVSSSMSQEHWKMSVSEVSLGGGDDPCAICASLSCLSRLSLLGVQDSSSGNGIGCQPHPMRWGGPQSWQLLGSSVGPELDSGWRGRVGSSAVLDLLAFRAFLTVVDFSALWLLVFFRALLLCFSSSSFGCLISLLSSGVRV